MIDSSYRTSYQAIFVDPLVKRIKNRVKPDTMTFLALGTGLLTMPAIAMGYTGIALFFLVLTGYLDTVDGSIARAISSPTPKGAILDIVSDRIVESGLILGLYLFDSENRGLICLLMLSSILICVTSFLLVGMFTPREGEKSFFYSPGMMERTEAFIFFACMILIPTGFVILGTLFTILVALTGLIRIKQFSP